MDVYQRRRLVALSAIAGLFIIFVLLIRSCGGDDEETPIAPVAGATGTGGATILTQADYIEQADAICLEANTTLANVDETDAAAAATDQSEIVTSELQQLQTLPPPDDGETKLDNFLTALQDLAAAYDDKATAAEREDEAAIAELDASIEEINGEVASAAENFGFEVCGDPSQVGESDTTGGDSDTGTDSTDASTETAPTDTGAVAPPVEEAPPITEPAPPADTGVTPAPPADTGGTDSSSGGVSP
jgi:hypothetical protein